MATAIGKLMLQLSANSEGMKADLDQAKARVDELTEKISSVEGGGRAIDGVTAKVDSLSKSAKATAQSLKMTGRATHDLASIGTMFQTGQVSAEGMTHAVMGTIRSIQLAARAGEGMKGVFMGLGVGLAIPVVASLLSDLMGGEDREKAGRSPLDDATARALSRAVGGRAVTAGRFGGAEVASRGDVFDRVAGVFGVSAPRAPDVSFTSFTVDAARATTALADLTRTTGDAARAGGRSAAEMTILAAEAHIFRERSSTATAIGRGDWAGAAVHDSVASDLTRGVAGMRAASIMESAATGARSMEEATAAARDMTATMGMSADRADEYRRSLRATSVTLGGVTVATTEALTPGEAYARRLEDITAAERRLGVAMAGARDAALASFRSETEGLVRLRAARDAAAGAAIRESHVPPLEREGREIDRIMGLHRRGAISFDEFRREMEGPVRATPLSALTDSLDSIRERMHAVAVAAPRGRVPLVGGGWMEGPIFDMSRFRERAREAVDAFTGDMRTPAEAFGDRMSAIATAWTASARDFGGAFDESFRRASAAATRAVLGDTRTVTERLSERVHVIEEARARAAEFATLRGEDFDPTAFDRAAAGAIEEATRSVHLEMPAGPGALDFGSASAISAIHEAMRAGPTDPAERAAASLDRLREIEAAAARDTAAIRDALRAGTIVLAPGPRV